MQAHFVTNFCPRTKQLRCVAEVTSAPPRPAPQTQKARRTAGPFVQPDSRSVARDDGRRRKPAEAIVQPGPDDMAVVAYRCRRETASRRREVGERSADNGRVSPKVVIEVFRFDGPVVPEGVF